MKIWVVGDSTVAWQIETWKNILPKFNLIEARIPETFLKFEEAVKWNEIFWNNVAKNLRKKENIVVVAPSSIPTKWGNILPKSVVFDLAILIKGEYDIVLGHAKVIKVIKAKNAIETAKLLLSFLKEML